MPWSTSGRCRSTWTTTATTGSYGFDYSLSALHFVFPRAGGINKTAAMEAPGVLQTYIWELEQHDSRTIKEGRIEVSVEDNTITLSGKIPGITAESRLAFGAIDFQGGTEEVGCFLSNSLGHKPFRLCTPYDAPVRVGNAVADDLSDVPAAHIDITAVDTSLSGETLTAVFHLRDVPEALTFNRAGIPDEEPEYGWKVFVDADNDPETGSGGIDYTLSAAHKVSSSSSGSGATAPIAAGRNVQVSTRKMTPEEGFVFLEDARIEVSAEDNTITLSGEIPGITTVSPLAFEAYDYSGGTEKVGCLSPVPVTYEGRCDSDDAMIAPGQTVSDGITDTLPAYMDITEVSTTLDGENACRCLPSQGSSGNTGVQQRGRPGRLCWSMLGLYQSTWTTTAKQADTWEMNTVCPPAASVIPRSVTRVFICLLKQLCRPTPGRWTRMALAPPI